MDELENILNNNVDLSEYLDEYGERHDFLYRFFLQKEDRLLDYRYDEFFKKLSVQDKVNIAKISIKNNWNVQILNRILNEIIYLDKKEVQELINTIFKMIRDKKLDINILSPIIRKLYCKKNPKTAIICDINNLNYVGMLSRSDLISIIKLLNEKKYIFTNNDQIFLEDNIYDNYENFVYFINNCNYDEDVSRTIYRQLNSFLKEKLYKLFYDINDNERAIYYKKKIISQLNYNNYDINTILKEEKIYLIYNSNKDEILSFIQILKSSNYSNDVIIQMIRVDLDFIEQAYKIFGDKLKVSPTMNQNRIDFNNSKIDDTLPFYSVDQIRKSERLLDMYASMVNDQVDQNGNIKSLSPLEKFIAAYLIVTKFAVYQKEEAGDSKDKSRAVYEIIISPSGTKIVCAGYVNLLLELLYRMGFKNAVYWSVVSEESKDKFDDHARLLIHLTDGKYNVDGIYMSDPTLDSNGLVNTSINHILLSLDELIGLDKNNEEKLHTNDTLKISRKLHVENVSLLFKKPIPKKTLIKACIALSHFLDRHTKTTQSDYSKLEYFEMAKKLHLTDNLEIPTFDELLNMPRQDLELYLEDNDQLRINFIVQLQEFSLKIEDEFKSKGINIPFVIALDYVYVLWNKNDVLPSNLLNSNLFEYIDGKEPRFIIYRFTNLSINESMSIVFQKLIEYQKLVDNLSSNKTNNGLK